MAAGVAAARQRRRRDPRRPHLPTPCAPTTAPDPSPSAYADASSTAPAPGRQTHRHAREHGAPAIRPASGAGELTWPVRGPVTSPFCERRAWEACHPGIDIAVPTGTPILAAATGRVTTPRPGVSGLRHFTCLQHDRPCSTCYAHQSRLGPTPSGGIVARGAPRRLVGCTGRCFGAHLHFEVRVNDQPVDPLPYLTGTGEMPRLDRSCSCSWSASWPGARTPTSKTARTTAAAQPARSRPCRQTPDAGQRVLARARARHRPDHRGQRARDRTVGRQRVLRPVDELGLAHDRTPAATARRASRPGRSPASSRQKPKPAPRIEALAPRPPRRPRARRRDRRQTRAAPRAERSVVACEQRYTDGRADLAARATASTSSTSRARATAGRSAQWQPQP